MTAAPSVFALVAGGVAATGVAACGAAVAAAVWRRLPRLHVRLAEPALALFGLIGTASFLTALLMLAWGVPMDTIARGAAGEAAFAAALCGTFAGHVSVITWALRLRAPLGLRRPGLRGWGFGVGAGLAALLSSGLWSGLGELLGHPVPDQGLVEILVAAPDPAARVAVIVFAVVVAPLLEELVFRGYLQTNLTASIGPARAIAVTSLLFGALHLSDPAVVPPLVAVGVILGVARHQTGSVFPAMVGHVLNNAVAVAFAFTA